MSVEMQMQLRHNVEQMHVAFHDLDDFIGDIGKRDAKLRGRELPSGESGIPGRGNDESDEEEEAREIEAAKEELRKLALEAPSTNMPAESGEVAIETGGGGSSGAGKATGKLTHAQKYGRWERYDADSVVSEMETREEEQERIRKEVVRLENKRAQAKARKMQAAADAAAEAAKLRGNAAFGSAKYEEAVSQYTEALEHTPRSAVLYANRAMALLKLGAHAEAEEDCDAALGLDAGHVKARLRRAQARQLSTKYEAALEDLEVVLEAEPRNTAARKQMQECRTMKAQATPRRKPPMTRLTVSQVDHDPDNDDDPFVQSLSLAPPPQTTSLSSPTASTSNAPPIAPATATSLPPVDDPTPGPSEPATFEPAPQPPPAFGVGMQATTPRVLSKSEPGAASFSKPSSAADFERALRSLRKQPAEFALYAMKIPPALLGSLFKHSLPAEALSALLAAIDTHYLPAAAPLALETLRALSTAGRFSILIMCLDKRDTQAVMSIFAKLDAACEEGRLDVTHQELKKLRSAYS